MCIKRQYELVRLGWLFFHANISSEATENQNNSYFASPHLNDFNIVMLTLNK